MVYGSSKVVQSLTKMGLIDEYQLLVHPVFLGDGKPLFEGMAGPTNLKLLRTQMLRNGVSVQYYEPKRGEPRA